jgi:hypothetical protein
MAPRNTISRLTSRIDDLAQRLAPNRGLTTVVGGNQAECRAQLQKIEAAGQRMEHVRLIITGVVRDERFGKV